MVLAVILLSPAAAIADDAVVILPRQFVLSGPRARQKLLAEVMHDGRYVGQIQEGVEFVSSEGNVVKIVDGAAVPVGNGTATIELKVGDQVARAQVTVTHMERPAPVSFRNDVQPLLTKLGCNSGACHGALAGKNGFALSLRGYNDDGDHHALTRHALGRRVSPTDPARSLMLLKPTAAVAHKGGQRLKIDSPEYRLLADWIASGAVGPLDKDPRIERIEFVPRHVVLKSGDLQQLVVLAHFSNGSVQDITDHVKYSSANSAVVNVGDNGVLSIAGHGEGAVTGWYLSKIAIATVTVPFENEPAPEIFSSAERANFIDDLVLAKLESLNLPPSPPGTDAQFVRRVHLDTIGMLPTVDQTRQFLANESPNKRNLLIESLLGRPEFVDYWSYRFSDLLLVNSRKLPASAMWSYYSWIRHQVAANTPWDEFARRLVTARGSQLDNGAANFFLLHDDPAKMSEAVSTTMLGMSIACAKCHNHPLEKWTNDQYYGMANLFARIRQKHAPGKANQVVYSETTGELVQPLTGRPQPPRPLDGKTMAFDDPSDRRHHLAEWLTAPTNPYFARAIVNRLWANFMGVGLVEAVDDMRLTNPASNETLLVALADYLVAQDFDLQALMRVIIQSKTYQRSSMPLPKNASDDRFYSRYFPRRLMAEVMLDAFSQVTGSPTQFAGYPPTWRAMQLPDANVESYFLSSFGRPDRLISCTCERSDEPSMAQVLHIANGRTINQKLAAKGNRIEKLLADGAGDEELIEDLFLTALCRLPGEKQKQQIMAVLAEAGPDQKRQAVEDLYWSILSSKEFLFNH